MSNKPTERTTKLYIVLGFNGTGKTTLIKKLFSNALNQPNRRGLVITPDDREWLSVPLVCDRFPERISRYVGARRMIFNQPSISEQNKGQKNSIEYASDCFSNGMLVLDDCRSYLSSNTSSEVHNLLIRRRQKSIDIIVAGHGFTEVPPKFFTFADKIILFKTKDNIHKRKDVLRDFDKMLEAQQRVNEKALSNPYYFEIIDQ